MVIQGESGGLITPGRRTYERGRCLRVAGSLGILRCLKMRLGERTEADEEHTSGPKGHFQFMAMMPGINPRPTARKAAYRRRELSIPFAMRGMTVTVWEKAGDVDWSRGCCWLRSLLFSTGPVD